MGTYPVRSYSDIGYMDCVWTHLSDCEVIDVEQGVPSSCTSLAGRPAAV